MLEIMLQPSYLYITQITQEQLEEEKNSGDFCSIQLTHRETMGAIAKRASMDLSAGLSQECVVYTGTWKQKRQQARGPLFCF
jgi:hypothetical protein